MKVKLTRISFAVVSSLLILTFFCSETFGASNSTPKPTIPVFTVAFEGKGSVTYKSVTTSFPSTPSECEIDTSTHEETITGVEWKAEWKKVKPQTQSYAEAKGAEFKGKLVRTRTTYANLAQCSNTVNNCPLHSSECLLGQDGCSGVNLIPYPNTKTDLSITKKTKKKGKTILTIQVIAERLVENDLSSMQDPFGTDDCSGNLFNDSNNGENVTRVTFELHPTQKSKKRKVTVPMVETFDCSIPQKDWSNVIISQNCVLKTDLSGTITVNGPWLIKNAKRS